MISLRAIPMVRLALPYALGIWASAWAIGIPKQYVLVFITMIATTLYVLGRKSLPVHRLSIYYGIGLSFFLFALGVFRMQDSAAEHSALHFAKSEKLPQKIIGIIAAPPKDGDWVKFPIQVQAAKGDTGAWYPATGNVLILASAVDLPSEELKYGSQVMLKANLVELQAPPNPYQFDYAAYLHTKNIGHQIFAKGNALTFLGNGHGNRVWEIVYGWRKNLLKILEKYLVSENTYAVGAALLLGHKDELSNEVRATFVETGTMHILAVSGAHVGILFGCLNFLFGLFPFYSRKWQIFEQISTLCFIWLFVLLTGAAEPAVRAALIFSLVGLARIIQRDHNIYNLLGFSAFCMLMYEPRLLFSIGFQFSFGAVLGIVLFMKKLRKLTPWKWPKMIKIPLDLVFMGISAQLGILPLSLLYFHQLPSFFWLTGTLAVPFMVVFIWLGIALLVGAALSIWISGVQVLVSLIGWLADKTLSGLNTMLAFFNRLPGHLIEHIWLTPWMAATLMVAIYGLAYTLYAKKEQRKVGAFAMVGGLFIISLGHFFHWYQASSQERIVVYAAGKNMLVDGFSGTYLGTMRDSIKEDKALFFAKNNRIEAGIRHFPTEKQESSNNKFYANPPVFACGNKRLAIIDKNWCSKAKNVTQEKIKVDGLYIRGNKPIDLESQLLVFQTQRIIVDGSSDNRNYDKWKAVAQKEGLDWLDLRESAVEI